MGKKDFKEKIKDDFKPFAPEEEETSAKARLKAFPGARLIPLSDIHPDPNQPRKKFDKEKLDELVASIKSKGIIEPITVRHIEDDGYYRIVTGERRYKAAQMAGLEDIPCIIKHLTEQEVFTYQLIENLQREDLSPTDEAAAFTKLMGTGLTQEKVAKMIGKSQPYISQSLKILDLPKSILSEAEKKAVTKEHLLQLVKAENPETLWEEIKTGKTAKEIKEQIRKPSRGRPKTKPWLWKPKNKAFTISIKFRNNEYSKKEIIKALEQAIQELRR